jgi:hypothetical protein
MTRRQPKSAAPKPVCALCERTVGKVHKHHLVPKSEGGTYTIDLCATCHATLHRFFTNHTLAREFCAISALRELPEIQRYLAWVKKQPDRHIPVRESHQRR